MSTRAVPGGKPRDGASRLGGQSVTRSGWLALGSVLASAAGCARGHEDDHAAGSVPVPTPADSARAASDSSLVAACDSIEAIVRRAALRADPSAKVSRDPATFAYQYAEGAKGSGYVIVLTQATSPCADGAIVQAMLDRGWQRKEDYQADGPDGFMSGFVTREALCVVEASWDGGDDSGSTYVPTPGSTLRLTVVPRRMDDVAHAGGTH